jgi:hypothetical protein
MPLTINSFKGDYAFLSNFFPAPTIHDGILYNCSEVAYAAAKSMDLMERIKFVTLNGAQAKKLGKSVKLREDWEEVKIKIMYSIVLDKFTRNPVLCLKLAKTGGAELVEGNYWHDTFWGVCNGVGSNHLGIILMEVRDLLYETVIDGAFMEQFAE